MNASYILLTKVSSQLQKLVLFKIVSQRNMRNIFHKIIPYEHNDASNNGVSVHTFAKYRLTCPLYRFSSYIQFFKYCIHELQFADLKIKYNGDVSVD